MLSPDVLNLVRDLKQAGGLPLLVGGYVRDVQLGLPGKDIDLEVFALDTSQLKKICRRHGHVMTVGVAFAVLKVAFDSGETIDVSVPRRERHTGEGHRGFEVEADPSMTVEDAAQRRDLTINAISMEPETGEFIDPTGGRADLDNKMLRHVSNRFQEDPLRVLRVVQFAARFGFEIAPETMRLCTEMTRAGDLRTLPRERVELEFYKLFVKGRPGHISLALEKAYVMGVFEELFPELHRLRAIPQDRRFHAEGDVLAHTFLAVDHAAAIAERDGLDESSRFVLCLAALAHDLGKAETTEVHEDGRVTSHGHDRVGARYAEIMLMRLTANLGWLEPALALIRTHMRPLYCTAAQKIGDAAIRRLARDVQPATLLDLARLVEADTNASVRTNGQPANAYVFLRHRAELLGVSKKPLPMILQGRDLIRLAREGRLPEKYSAGGPHFGVVLAAVYDAQLEGLVTDAEAAERLACEIAGQVASTD